MEYRNSDLENQVKLTAPSAPFTIHFLLTPRCNLRCRFCGVSDRYAKKSDRTFTQMKPVIDGFLDTEPFVVELSGGEPSIYRDLSLVAKYIGNQGVTQDLYTNANYVPKNFGDIAPHILNVGVSIHGVGSTHDDIVRMKGSFKKCIQNLKKLKKYDTGLYAFFSAVPENYDTLPELAEFLTTQFDISYIGVNRVVGCEQEEARLSLSVEEINRLLDLMSETSKKIGIEIVLVDKFPFCLIENRDNYSLVSACGSGIINASVDAYGDVYFCTLSPFPIGNINQKPLRNIWNSSIYQQYRSLNFLADKCKKCNMLPACMGGCNISSTLVQTGQKIFDIDQMLRGS